MRIVFLLKELLRYPRSFFGGGAVWRMDGATPEEVARHARSKLDRLLREAVAHVPYYRELARRGVIDAESPELARFPVLGKADFRGHEEDFVSDRRRLSRLSASRTSGSTGEPFRFYRDPREFDASYVALWRGLKRIGIRRGDRRVLVKGVDEAPRVSAWKRARRRLYEWINQCIVVDAHFLARSEENIRRSLQRIRRYRPVYVHGYVSSIDLLAASAGRFGIRMDDLGIRAVVTESEKLYEFQRERISRVFGCPVAENYGSVEFGMIAQPDAEGNLCVNEDHCLVETDADGEAVLTNLDAYAFPFIRFKNGDRLTFREKKKSALPYREIERIDGRVADAIRLPDGNALQGFIVMYPVSKHMKFIRQYQIRQRAASRLEILIVPDGEFPAGVRGQILSEMRELTGPGVETVITLVDEIPLTKRGKRRFVASDMGA